MLLSSCYVTMLYLACYNVVTTYAYDGTRAPSHDTLCSRFSCCVRLNHWKRFTSSVPYACTFISWKHGQVNQQTEAQYIQTYSLAGVAAKLLGRCSSIRLNFLWSSLWCVWAGCERDTCLYIQNSHLSVYAILTTGYGPSSWGSGSTSAHSGRLQ